MITENNIDEVFFTAWQDNGAECPFFASLPSIFYAGMKTSNPNLTKIVNKTGKSFDWGFIVNGISGYIFITGTVKNDYGNVEVVNN